MTKTALPTQNLLSLTNTNTIREWRYGEPSLVSIPTGKSLRENILKKCHLRWIQYCGAIGQCRWDGVYESEGMETRAYSGLHTCWKKFTPK